MLQALLHNKLTRYLWKSPYQIEDLLTSLVFGTCEYLPPDMALLPFLHGARNAQGSELGILLDGVTRVRYEFWPRWGPIEAEEVSGEGVAAGESIEPDSTQENSPATATPGAQPEVLLTLDRNEKSPALILIEAKLICGKSSRPTGDGPVNDQLGKYWLHLQQRAEETAEAVAVVYITRELTLPQRDFFETQEELSRKGYPAAPLFWLSWRQFESRVKVANPQGKEVPQILSDLLRLLVEKWGMTEVKMQPWPFAPALPGNGWYFPISWHWPRPAVGLPLWEFQTTWRWPRLAAGPVWEFQTRM